MLDLLIDMHYLFTETTITHIEYIYCSCVAITML